MHTNLAQKVTKGKIWDGSISQHTFHEMYVLTMYKVSCFYQKVHNSFIFSEYAALLLPLWIFKLESKAVTPAMVISIGDTSEKE